jgi:hypothetical protein
MTPQEIGPGAGLAFTGTTASLIALNPERLLTLAGKSCTTGAALSLRIEAMYFSLSEWLS